MGKLGFLRLNFAFSFYENIIASTYIWKVYLYTYAISLKDWSWFHFFKIYDFIWIMAFNILQNTAKNVQNIYSIMGDKSSDISSKERVVLCMRWVNNDLEIHEDFLVF